MAPQQIVEAFNHLSKQVKTVADRRVLQDQSLFGCEPKSLPETLKPQEGCITLEIEEAMRR